MNDRPNIVLLIFDSLRADYVSAYGADTETPAIDSLAERGTLFENAFSVAGNTAVSHGAIFTGRYPTETGVATNAVDIPKDEPHIAEILGEAGYDTFGIAGPGKMDSTFGYDRGFDEYFESYRDIPGASSPLPFVRKAIQEETIGNSMLRYLSRALTQGPGDQAKFKFDILEDKIRADLTEPYFAMANITTVHRPYDPPRPFKQQATPELNRGRWEFLDRLRVDAETFDRENVRMDRIRRVQHGHGIVEFMADPSWLNDAEIDILRAWYAASLEYLDTRLQEFLDYLEESGSLEDTIVVLTADHGEYLGEHGLWEHHGTYYFDEVLHVPLVIAGGGVPQKRRSDLTSLIDLVPTICEFANISSGESLSGQSLFGPGKRDAVVAETAGAQEAANVTDVYKDRLPEDLLWRYVSGIKCVKTEEYSLFKYANGVEEVYERPEGRRVESPDLELLTSLRDRMFDSLPKEFRANNEQVLAELDEDLVSNLEYLGYID